MLGAIIGDVVGSVYEFDNVKTTDFPLFGRRSQPTDDTVMTLAVAKGLLDAGLEPDGRCKVRSSVESAMRELGRAYPRAGYGGKFRGWLSSLDPKPYNSLGNGSAMRVSPVAWLFDDLATVRAVARETAMPTHNHPEGVKGAEAVAACIFLARQGVEKHLIRTYVQREFGYDLSRTCDQIRPSYRFDETCPGSVPQAITAFLEGDSFERVLRLAVSLGGDSDTIACIACAIAEGCYPIPEDIKAEALARLDDRQTAILDRYHEALGAKRRERMSEVELYTSEGLSVEDLVERFPMSDVSVLDYLALPELCVMTPIDLGEVARDASGFSPYMCRSLITEIACRGALDGGVIERATSTGALPGLVKTLREKVTPHVL